MTASSIKENILFGQVFDVAKYRAVVEACSLGADLAEMEDGDQRLCVGLSGGQRSVFLRIC